MNFRKSLAKTSALLLLTLAMPMASVFAQSFAQPQSAPPNGNVAAPINVGSTAQTRTGDLTLENMLTVLGDLVVNTNGVIKNTLKIGGSVMSSGYALDVTSDGTSGPTLKSVLGALLVSIVRVQSLAHVGADQPVCATATGDLVLCGASVPGTGSSGPVTATLTATPVVSSTNQTLLTWSSTNATSCVGSGFTTNNATSGTVTVSPTVTTTYVVTCSNTTNTNNASVVVTVGTPGPSLALTAAPTSITLGQSFNLTWTTSRLRTATTATPQCAVNTPTTAGGGTWTGIKNGNTGTTSSSLSATITPTTTGAKVYNLTCYGTSGTTPVTDSVTVNVTSAPVGLPPTITLTPSASTITLGQSFNLTWTGANLASCSAISTPSFLTWSGNVATSSTAPLSFTPTAIGTKTFDISCTGTNGTTVTDSAEVLVSSATPLPTIAMYIGNTASPTTTATPLSVGTTGFHWLGWSSTNATSCSTTDITGLTTWNSATGTSVPSIKINNPSTPVSRTYTVTCTGSTGTVVSKSVSITSTPVPTITIFIGNTASPTTTATPLSVGTTGSHYLGWSSTNATSCSTTDIPGLTTWNSATGTSNPSIQIGNPTTPMSRIYTVTCTNSAGASASSTVAITSTPPPAVANVVATPGPTYANITASITNATTSIAYVQISTNSTSVASATQQNGTLSGTAFSKTIASLTPNTTYYYRVCTQNASTPICSSVQSFVSSQAIPAITSVITSAITTTGAQVSAYHTNSTSAIIKYGTQISSPITAAPVQMNFYTAPSPASITLTGLLSNTTYYYQVCGVNNAGDTTCSSTQNFKTLLPAPTITTPTAGSQLGTLTDVVGGCVTGSTVTITKGSPSPVTRTVTCVNSNYSTIGIPLSGTGTQTITAIQTISGVTSAPVSINVSVCNNFCPEYNNPLGVTSNSVNLSGTVYSLLSSCTTPKIKFGFSSPSIFAGSYNLIPNSLNEANFSITLNGLTPNTNYNYQISKECSGTTTLLKTGQVMTDQGIPPTAPTLSNLSGNQNNYITTSAMGVPTYHKDIGATASINLNNNTYSSSRMAYKPTTSSSWSYSPATLSGTTLTSSVQLSQIGTQYGTYDYKMCATSTGFAEVCTPSQSI